MPRSLAGFRWDDDKQRYFALSTPVHSVDRPPCTTERPRLSMSSYRALSDLRSVCRTSRKDALVHQVQSSQISLTDTTTRSVIPLQSFASAFQTVCHDGRVYSFAGDTFGWLFSSVVDQESDTVNQWQPHYYLSSEISSITTSPTSCVVTSFGPECKILYIPLDSPMDGMYVNNINSRIVHDVWTTDLFGSRLVLGANKQAVVIDNIAGGTPLHRLPTQSDVFALAQCENLLYTGLRNGSIIRFDTRVQRSKACLFDGTSQRKSSITGLKHIHDHHLVVGFLDGKVSAFDLRFPIRTPIMNFTGNLNSYTTRLPLVTDPQERFLFTAGQDNKIRIWSLATGGPPLGTGSIHQRVFEHPFEHRVAALQVVEERKGMCLWAVSGTELCKYSLCHRSGIGI